MIDYKINVLKQVIFLHITNNLLENIVEETKILVDKLNKMNRTCMCKTLLKKIKEDLSKGKNYSAFAQEDFSLNQPID